MALSIRTSLTSGRPFVVVSGLPASGKTTIARPLGSAFALPFYDKDAILEALFDALGCADAAARQHLSRASDGVLQTLVEQSQGAVITSFWRRPGSDGRSGTPSDWLAQLSSSMVEVYCRCDPEVAARRFLARARHPGHHDGHRSAADLLSQFREVAAQGPLGLGQVIVFDSSDYGDTAPLLRDIARALGRGAENAEP